MSPELIHLIIGSLYYLLNSFPFSQHSASDNHRSTLFYNDFNFLDSTCKWNHAVFVFLYLAYLT